MLADPIFVFEDNSADKSAVNDLFPTMLTGAVGNVESEAKWPVLGVVEIGTINRVLFCMLSSRAGGNTTIIACAMRFAARRSVVTDAHDIVVLVYEQSANTETAAR